MNQSFDYKYNKMSFGGCDITAILGGTIFGQLQAISFNVQREKGPVYVMGSSDPVAFARGKRAIAGSMVFIDIDKSSFLSNFNEDSVGQSQFFAKKRDIRYDFNSANAGRESFSSMFGQNSASRAGGETNSIESLFSGSQGPTIQTTAWFMDQIPPFDVFLSADNEAGGGMKKTIAGVEILNEGSGVSIDDLVLESQCTFIAKSMSPWIKTTGNNN